MSLPQCETQRVIPSGQNNEHQMFARRFSTASYLDEAEREVVVLKTFAGLTFAAIGEVLEQSEKTVATRYRRALLKLEEKLRGQL
jgi:RNA polymerase sigma factor (sigma-70 family)